MSFYDLSKIERKQRVDQIHRDIQSDLEKKSSGKALSYFSNDDTYIRKAAYQSVGKIYSSTKPLQQQTIALLNHFAKHKNEKVRQTTINAAGEIGVKDFDVVEHVFDRGLFDEHHCVRNAVIGSVKKCRRKIRSPYCNGPKNICITTTKKCAGKSVMASS